LFKHTIDAETHNGVKTLFFKEFILTNKMDKEWGKLYADLFDWRQESDYMNYD